MDEFAWSVAVLDEWVDNQPFADARSVEHAKLGHGNHEIILRDENTARNDYQGASAPLARLAAARDAWLQLPESARVKIRAKFGEPLTQTTAH